LLDTKIFEKKNLTLTLILIITLIAFYPVLSAKLISLDDTELIMNLNSPDKNWSFKGLFLPHSIDRYYRPLLSLTFIFDSKIWLLEPSGYHLTNYLLHALNAMLLFFIAQKLFISHPKHNYLAGVSALLFSIHPLTCESVAWVSGRSDIFGTFFCLLAFNFFLSRFKGKEILVALSILLGLLSKENALAIIPLILISNFFLLYSKKKGLRYSAKSTIYWLIMVSIPFFIYLYLRMDGFHQFDHGIKMAVSTKVSQGSSFFDSSLFFFAPAAIAFYIKKLFLPFPLNFAICQINLLFYFSLFMIIIISSIYLLKKKKYSYGIWAVLVLATFPPAILVATSKMAWTTFAERYLYLTVPVWSLAMGTLIMHIKETMPRSKIFIEPVVASILIIFSLATFQRSLVWQDNLTLWKDTYQKSPNNGKVLFKYGAALGNPKGLKCFKKAVKIAKDEEWKDFSLLALAEQAKKDKNHLQALGLIEQAIRIKPAPEYYYKAADILRNLSESTKEDQEKNTEKSIEYYKKAYQKKRDPFALFQIGALHQKLNNYPEARFFFNEIITKFPSSRYAGHARKRLTSIRNNIKVSI